MRPGTPTPGPTSRRQRLAYHSEEDMLELEARAGVYVRPRTEALDGITGQAVTEEQTMRGWTAQQPFVHVDCPVMHRCVLCAIPVDPDFLRDHQRTCPVALELAG